MKKGKEITATEIQQRWKAKKPPPQLGKAHAAMLEPLINRMLAILKKHGLLKK